MSQAQNKTVQTGASVQSFVDGIKDETRREEVRKLIALMKRATKSPPRMWGSAIIGFGDYRYKYESGREGDWFIAGLSPRKANLTIYLLPGLHLHAANLKTLGKFTTGKSCIYIKKLNDVHLPTLEKMTSQAVRDMNEEIKRRGGS